MSETGKRESVTAWRTVWHNDDFLENSEFSEQAVVSDGVVVLSELVETLLNPILREFQVVGEAHFPY